MPTDHALLASVRHSLRVLNGAIETGSKAAGLTLQQQAFLLSLAARGGRQVPLAELRADLGMDQATTSELLERLVRRGFAQREAGRDRRAVMITITADGRARFARSLITIHREIRAADARGDLRALRRNLRDYLAFHTK
ncbi:MAG TPA: MarR family transcriptional regulator [Candidatus Limnocylindria bacterium]|jgi:DNA-binding MarR family transcriptional regulator|nr:MarR family transcriptional regulator [Candidatus Limnocylindria bacterium]